jgi:hypothetical protein
MTSNYVSNIQASTVGFGTATTSATQDTYTQLPSLVCDEVLFNQAAIAIGLASSATPAGALYYITASTTLPVWIPTGGNLNNLYFTNHSSAVATAVSFMWRKFNKPGRT